jgi:hypothetical protein
MSLHIQNMKVVKWKNQLFELVVKSQGHSDLILIVRAYVFFKKKIVLEPSKYHSIKVTIHMGC